MQAGAMDQTITWLSPPEGSPSGFSEETPQLWTEWKTVKAYIRQMSPTQAQAAGAGEAKEMYEITFRRLPELTTQDVGKWTDPEDGAVYLQPKWMSQPQRGENQMVRAVKVPNPNVASGAEECD